MKRLLTLLFFAFFAITTQAQTAPDLPPGSVPFGTGLFRAPDGDIWGGSKFDGYVNLGNWQRVADSLGAKINWSDTTLIASKEWVEGKLNSLPPSGVLSVTGDGVDNTDPANPVLSYPDPSDIGALAPGDNVSDLTNDAGYLTGETDPVYSGDPASSITQNDIDEWDAKQDAITGAATTVVSSNLTASRALISNGSGKIAVSPVSSTELAFLGGVTSNVQDQLDAKIPLSQKGASNGVAPIGNDGKIPGEYLPSSGSYKGTWDASTNTPTIADGVGTNGDRYRVSVGGTVDLGSGPITFVAGDDVIYNGTVWQRSPSGVTVTSVAGKTGDVVLDKNDVGLGNVDNTSDLDKPISNDTQDALDGKEDAFSKGNLVAGTGITASGTLSSRLVGSGNVTFNFDQSWGDSRYALISNIPPAQTLSLGSNAGQLSISGGNSVNLASVAAPTYSGAFEDFNPNIGIWVYRSVGGSTGYPGTSGGGIRFNRNSTNNSGAFDIFKSQGTSPKLYYTVGLNGPWEQYTFASEEWVNSLPGLTPQTLSLGPGSGEISISGGNNIRLTDLFSRTSDSFDDFTRVRGLFPYTYLSTATGYVGIAGGTGIRSNRSGTSYVGAFDIIAPSSGAPRLMFNVGSGAETWAGWQTFASEEWVSNNYYTKTNLQTSGQAQVHWGNVTNVPSGLGVQTLSTAQGANNLTISGGNSVTLNNLYYKSAPNFPDDVTSQSSGFHPLNISSGTGWPSSFGYALLARRPSGENNNNGSFVLFKSSTNDNKIRYSTGAGETWNAFSTFASEEHVAANYVTLGTNQTITGVKTLTGSAIPLRLQAADLAIYIPFLASDGSTRKGYIGFPTTSPSDIFINNDSGGTLKVKSGINGLTYDYGSGDKTVWHSGNLDPDGFLKLSSASSQEVTGPVVFSGNPQVPLTPASSNSAIAKGYLDNTLTSYALDNSVVKLTGNQNIFGEKTFEGTVRHYGGLILENEPISDKMAATKKYVDDAIADIPDTGTDLGITGTTGARTITSSTGTGAVIPAANGAVSGVMTPTHVNQLVTAYGHTLQSVTNNGKVTNNGIVITGGGISANSNSLQIFKNTNNVGQIGYFYPSGGGVAQGAFFSLQADTAILGIGNAASSMKIYIDGGPKLDFLGDVTAAEFYRTSTRKIKKDIAPFSENATSILNGVDVVEYKLKKGPDYKKIGFIAEDTHEYLATPEHNVMDQGSTIGLLIKAVQELSAKVEELERRLAECQE